MKHRLILTKKAECTVDPGLIHRFTGHMWIGPFRDDDDDDDDDDEVGPLFRSTMTRDRNLQFQGAVSTGLFEFSPVVFPFLEVFSFI